MNNLIVHGLVENPNESPTDLENRVEQMFDYMGESMGSVNSITRLGTFKEGATRPIKLNLSGKEFRDQIISRKRVLQKCDDYKDVFLSKDRSTGERDKRKKFVKDGQHKRKTRW